MSMITIEKNVPLPPRPKTGGRKSIYPWDALEVGDSFVFPKEVKRSTAGSLTQKAGKAHERRFAIRLMAEGIRCWRTA